MIDTDVLEKAIHEVAMGRLKAEIREWIVMTAPPDILAIYHLYGEMMVQKANDDELTGFREFYNAKSDNS